MEIVILTTSMC